MICGSLKEVNELGYGSRILNMDLQTAKYINGLINDGMNLKTIENRFFHGKLMIFESEDKTVIINSSSNISHSAFRENIELNTAIVCKKENSLSKNYTNYFNELLKISTTINHLNVNLFVESEIENQLTTYEELEPIQFEEYIFDKIDRELFPYYKYWISRAPKKIYENIYFLNYNPYIGMYNVDKTCNDFFEYIIKVANGEKIINEINNYREIAIFKNGVTL